MESSKGHWKIKHVGYHKEAVDRIQSHGIRVIGCFVLGLNGDRPDIFGQVLDYAREPVSQTYRSLSRPLSRDPPDRAFWEGRILREGAWDFAPFRINFLPKNMTVEELQEGFLWLAERSTPPRRRKPGRRFRTPSASDDLPRQ